MRHAVHTVHHAVRAVYAVQVVRYLGEEHGMRVLVEPHEFRALVRRCLLLFPESFSLFLPNKQRAFRNERFLLEQAKLFRR